MLPRFMSNIVLYCLDAVTDLFYVISSCISICYIQRIFFFYRIHTFCYISDISIFLSLDYICRYILSPKHRSIAPARDLQFTQHEELSIDGSNTIASPSSRLSNDEWLSNDESSLVSCDDRFSCDDVCDPCAGQLVYVFKRFHEYVVGVSDFNSNFN